MKLTTVARPFRIAIAQEMLDDLRDRLTRTRWPDELAGTGWVYGTNLAYLQELVTYWRAQERAHNRFHHAVATVDGLDIHFIHERGTGPSPLPLVLSHGWPGSVYEMHKLIPLLADPARFDADPADAFHVIVPSLPGYGFSARPRRPGMAHARIAELWAELMTQVLGYARFAAHGGDFGAYITTELGWRYPDRLRGIHLTAVAAPYLRPDAPELPDAERAYVALQERWQDEEGAYKHQQGTRPQTLAYGPNDSPVGLAGRMVEKFRAWSDCGGDVERRFSKDELLTAILIYWVTETMPSAIHLYYETRHSAQPGCAEWRVHHGPLRGDADHRACRPRAARVGGADVQRAALDGVGARGPLPGTRGAGAAGLLPSAARRGHGGVERVLESAIVTDFSLYAATSNM